MRWSGCVGWGACLVEFGVYGGSVDGLGRCCGERGWMCVAFPSFFVGFCFCSLSPCFGGRPSGHHVSFAFNSYVLLEAGAIMYTTQVGRLVNTSIQRDRRPVRPDVHNIEQVPTDPHPNPPLAPQSRRSDTHGHSPILGIRMAKS